MKHTSLLTHDLHPPSPSKLPPVLQRACKCGNHTAAGECEYCSENKGKRGGGIRVRRRQTAGAEAQGGSPLFTIPSPHSTGFDAPGQPLDESARAFLEPRFGAEFSQVRVHTGREAAASAQALQARAYTVGRHLVFNSGEYAPRTPTGRDLLAHELAHVVQQGGQAAGASPTRVTQPGEALETQAQRMAQQALMGQPLPHPAPVSGSASALMRQTSPREARAVAGEAGMGFAGYRAEEGWAFLTGPGGTAGHRWNEPGFDGVAFRVSGPFQIDILDNKSLARPGNVSSATALTTNLVQNLDDLISTASQARFNDVPRIDQVRSALQSARGAVASGQALPSTVRLVVTNFGGRSTGVTASLASRGVIFRSLSSPPPAAISGQTPPAAGGGGQPPAGGGPGQPSPGGGGSTQAAGGGGGGQTTPPAGGGPPAGSGGSQAARGGRGRTTATVGVPDMSPPQVGGPSARGQAIGAGITLAFQGVNLLLNWLNDREQARRVQAALSSIEPGIARNLADSPSLGVLLIFYYHQIEAPPESLLQPGAVFDHLETAYGRTRDEAEDNFINQPAIRSAPPRGSNVRTQYQWIRPRQPAGISALRTPFPAVAVGTFAGGRTTLQDVEWGGLTGFDDEGQSSLQVPAGVTPQFLILRLPAEFEWFYQGRHTSNPPIGDRAAAEGGSVPVVSLDPYMPFFNVAAAYVFPADDQTASLFQTARATRDNLRHIRYVNFGRGRWVRPENIRVIRRF